jgi:CO/xanthine dehydrogenase FAD-binding subunit
MLSLPCALVEDAEVGGTCGRARQLTNRRYDPNLVEEIAHEAIRTGKPLRTSASTPEYRRHVLRAFVRRALQELWQQGRS